jgi:hypothetical protein
MPFAHNAFIAGYFGYLELEALAGEPVSSDISDELERLLDLRVTSFTKDSAYAYIYAIPDGVYCRTLSVSSNFMYLIPELAQELNLQADDSVRDAITEYEELAPYWFVSLAGEGYAEDPRAPLYDAHAQFMARAWILQEPYYELQKYLDVPAFATGDLYYIQKLVAALESEETIVDLPARAYLPLLPLAILG